MSGKIPPCEHERVRRHTSERHDMKVYSYLYLVRVSLLFSLSTVIFPSFAEEKLPDIVKRVQPSVVVVLTYDEQGNQRGLGSGFFVSQDGDIISNHHVLQGAYRAEIRTAEGQTYPITGIVAEDKEGDLIRAAVNIPRKLVHPIRLSPSIPKAGERVMVIGNPWGFAQTVSDGIVSAVREVPTFGKIIQFTAPISPGSSGSPVLNMKGEVIGVVRSQIIKGQNLNFAIPSDRVFKLKPGKGKTLAEWETVVEQEELYLKGLTFLLAGAYERALSYLEKAVKKNPRDAHTFFLVGYCNGELGHHTKAIEAYKQVVRLRPDYAEAYYNLGVNYDKLGCYAEAIEAYYQAICIKPDHADALNNRGMLYGKLGRYDEGIRDLKQAIRLKPDYAQALWNLGVIYGKVGRYDEAIKAYRQGICMNPDDPKAHFNLGGVYEKLRRYAEAKEAYKQAIRIRPDYEQAHFRLGVVYLAVGDKASALDEYKILKRLNNDLANQLFDLIYR